MQITTQVNPKALEAISLFVAKEETRYALNGVLIEAMPTETRIVATDGHFLGIYRMLQDNNVDRTYTAIISVDAIKQVKAMTCKLGHGYMINVTMMMDNSNFRPSLVTFVCESASKVTTEPIDGRYPDYLMVMPKEISGQPSTYAPERLVTFDKAAKILSKHSRSSNFFDTCRLYQNGTGTGVAAMQDDPNFTGVVMPTKADPKGPAIQLWWSEDQS